VAERTAWLSRRAVRASLEIKFISLTHQCLDRTGETDTEEEENDDDDDDDDEEEVKGRLHT